MRSRCCDCGRQPQHLRCVKIRWGLRSRLASAWRAGPGSHPRQFAAAPDAPGRPRVVRDGVVAGRERPPRQGQAPLPQRGRRLGRARVMIRDRGPRQGRRRTATPERRPAFHRGPRPDAARLRLRRSESADPVRGPPLPHARTPPSQRSLGSDHQTAGPFLRGMMGLVELGSVRSSVNGHKTGTERATCGTLAG